MSYDQRYVDVERWLYLLEKRLGLKIRITYQKRYEKKQYTVYVGDEQLVDNVRFKCLYAMMKLANLVLERCINEEKKQV